ncbi:hypothetical protein V6N11_004669 [Hibiscus sabdariffa]|uniref:SWIM-type domain-containing protein n=1 Tax=Hibiscus sabdariffa TaxID=183260 RepID=A0ABR2SGY7_9ROSI
MTVIADTWREFAPCFLKLYQYEEDQLSVCLDGNKGKHEKSLEITLQFAVVEQMLEFSTYKATCAAHLYGEECHHVVKTLLAACFSSDTLPISVTLDARTCMKASIQAFTGHVEGEIIELQFLLVLLLFDDEKSIEDSGFKSWPTCSVIGVKRNINNFPLSLELRIPDAQFLL